MATLSIEQIRTAARKAIKDLGLTNKDLSLSVKWEGYSKVINAKIKSENVNLDALKAALGEFENIHKCEKTGEILSGGNTFVSLYDSNNYYISLW